MPRKKVTRLRKFCGQLAGHSWRRAERVTAAAVELLRPVLPDDAGVLTALDFLLYLGELLEKHRGELTSVDNQHNHELQVDHNLRQERDAATAKARFAMLGLRDSLDGLFGPGGGRKIFEDAPAVPNDPMALHQLMGHVIDNLGNEQFPMPRPLQEGFSLDREGAVRDLQEPYQRLSGVLTGLEGTQSDSKFSQTRKDGQVEDTEVFAYKVARYFEAYFDLVNLDGLSDRVRNSSHRAAGDDDEPPAESEGPEAESASEPAASDAESEPEIS